MKIIYIFKIYLFILFIIFYGSFSKGYSDESSNLSISENDLKFLEKGDTNSASVVLMKIRRNYEKEGKNAVVPAIPALINRTMNDLKMDESNKLGEGEGEFLGNLLWALAVTGDERVEPVLFAAMLDDKLATRDIPKGFLNIGKSTFPKLLAALKSANDSTSNLTIQSRCNIIVTLQIMARYDSTDTYFTENDKKIVKEELLKSTNNKNQRIRIFSVSGLGYFGDKSIIPILNEIKTSDPFQEKNGKYLVRIEAEKAIENITKR